MFEKTLARAAGVIAGAIAKLLAMEGGKRNCRLDQLGSRGWLDSDPMCSDQRPTEGSRDPGSRFPHLCQEGAQSLLPYFRRTMAQCDLLVANRAGPKL